MVPYIRAGPRFTHSLSLPWGSFHKLLILIRQKADRNKTTHNHRKLNKWIIWITVLSTSMKLWDIPCRGMQDGLDMVENSGKMWSTGERKWKTNSVFLLWKPHEQFKTQNKTKQKDRTLKCEHSRLIDALYASGNQWRSDFSNKGEMEPKENNTQLCIWLVIKVWCFKEWYFIGI